MMLRTLISSLMLSALLALPVVATAADLNERVFLFQKKMAETGNAKAQYKVGYMYEIGRGVKKDLASARKFYTMSAAQTFPAAGYRLKYLDAKTRGFSQADRGWFKQLVTAAKQGDGEMLFLVGEMYEQGAFDKPDLKKARHYFLQSKARGNPDADARVYKLDRALRDAMKAEEEEKARLAAARKAELEKQRREKEVAEEARKREAARQAKARKLEAERKRLEAERRKLAVEKRKLAEQRKAIASKQESAPADKPAASPATQKEEVFESDLCSGAAARFMTQCD